MTLAEIAHAVRGTLVLNDQVKGEVNSSTIIRGDSQTDSREIQPGQIFFAKRGEETDGHLFASAAADRGAVLLIVEHEVDEPVAQIVVEDTVLALGALAKEVVSRVAALGKLQVVGITGSNGKTTTKNLLAAMAELRGETVSPVKSFNNEVGAPLTMLKLTESSDFLVQEMGASVEGDIDRLVAMAHPNIAIVLSVGLAHAGEFGGIEATFRAKSEMVRCLNPEDVAILNRMDPRVAKMSELTRARIVWFGLTPECDVWASDVISDARGTQFTLHIGTDSASVRFSVLGEHHVMNALAASAAATELGVPFDSIVKTLENATLAARWRMELLVADPVTIINDAYNASPTQWRQR